MSFREAKQPLSRALNEADFQWWRQHCEDEAAREQNAAAVQHKLAAARKMLKMAEGHYQHAPDDRHLQIARTAAIRIEVMETRLKQLRQQS